MTAPVSVRAPFSPLRRPFAALRRMLPEGGGLPDEVWQRRHRGIVSLLWLHVPGIVLFGLIVEGGWRHVLVEVTPIAAAAFAASRLRDRRTLSTVVASAGLVTCSAVIVHLSGGVIEAHFHFFVMVGVVVLYQDWWPFLVAIGYVVLHHGGIGTFVPHDVYNHPAAVNGPWKWAAIHGGFILAMSTAGVVTWRLNDSLRKATFASEQHLAEAQQLAQLGSWEWDVGTGRIWSSDVLAHMFGFPLHEQLTVDHFVERVYAEDRQEVVDALEEALERGSSFSMDFRFVTPSGDVRWLHSRGDTVLVQPGPGTRMRGTGQDITERKRAEIALARESRVRDLLQTVAVAANEASTVQDAMQTAVEQVCRFLDWPVGHAYFPSSDKSLVSAPVWHLRDRDRFDTFRLVTEETSLDVGVGLAGRVSETATPLWIADLCREPSFTRRDAAREAGLCSAVLFPVLESHEAAGVLEFFSTRPEPIDHQLLDALAQVGRQLGLVVQRTRARDALRASEERSRTIIETASDAFVGMDSHGIIVEWNRRAELIFGWSREEVVGREIAELIIPKEFRGAHREGLRRDIETGRAPIVSGQMMAEALRRDGTCFPVELAVWEVRSPTECSFNAFVRDISHHKEAEEALASARDQALEVSRLKSEFVANMSHEIRTPMNGVIGLTNLLLDTRLDDTQRRYTEGIQAAGEALLTLINGILDFSKIEAGQIELEHVDFDLQQLVEESTGLLATAAAAKRVELVGYSYPSLPRFVRGDPGRLRQVLINLLGNAVKFTEQGEVILRARLEQDDGDHISARFEVVDTGIGIDKGTRERIFEPFIQADASTSRHYGGTGLGLALSKRLVKAMGGDIGVESEVGVGSTFWFTMPLAKQPEGMTKAALPLPLPSLVGVRALVVDDNETNRLILGQQLANWGMRPDIVEEPGEALQLVRAATEAGQPYGVALLDMQMPEMSGLELADAIKECTTVSHPQVILLSSVGTLSAAGRAQNAIRLSLAKPVRQSELLDALLEVLAPHGELFVKEEAIGAPVSEAEGSKGRVLIAEDNDINRTVAVGTLAKLGYRAEIATSGREAVEAACQQAYTAVLMDCQMPGMDGYQATQKIREREGNDRHVPIIAMTASAMDGDRERCLAAGMDDYITKPIRVDEVEAALARWTNSAPAS